MLSFAGRTVLVTGAGRGLGRAHALAFAARGAHVIVNDVASVNDAASGERYLADVVAAEAAALGGRATASRADLLKSTAAAELIEAALSATGRVDIIVHNAGFLRDARFGKMTMADFRAVMDIHVNAVAALSMAAWPTMVTQQYGRFVMTTSGSGLYGNAGQANYAAAKLAQVGLMKTLHLEGAKHNIRANALAPGALTPMTAPYMPPGAGALLAPEHVAAVALWLAAEDAPSGEVVCAMGGLVAVARTLTTRGVVLEHSSPESVRARWSEIAAGAELESFGSALEEITSRIGRVSAARSTAAPSDPGSQP